MHPRTLASRRLLYERAGALIRRDYRTQLTLSGVAGELASSARELQRAYAQFGEASFAEELRAHRLRVAADLLGTQRWIGVREVARLVGYADAPQLAQAFCRRFALTPGEFRRRALAARASGGDGLGGTASGAG